MKHSYVAALRVTIDDFHGCKVVAPLKQGGDMVVQVDTADNFHGCKVVAPLKRESPLHLAKD